MCRFRKPVLSLLALFAAGPLPLFAEGEETTEFRPALLVIDIQNEWLPRMAEEDKESAPPKINEAIAFFRERGLPVIRVYHSDPEKGPAIDSEAFRFPETIAITEDDPRVIKDHGDSFTGTELARLLRDDDRNLVVLCGLSATGCVLATYFGAFNNDFMAVLLKDALIGPDASHTDSIEEIFHAMTLPGLKEALGE